MYRGRGYGGGGVRESCTPYYNICMPLTPNKRYNLIGLNILRGDDQSLLFGTREEVKEARFPVQWCKVL